MKFKKQLAIFISIPVLLTIISGTFLVLDYHGRNMWLEKNRLASELRTSILERSILQEDMLLRGTDRAVAQWQSKNSQIERMLRQIRVTFNTPEEQSVINTLNEDNQSVENLASRLIAIWSEPDRESLKQLLISQLLIKKQDVSESSTTLSVMSREKLASSQTVSGYVMGGSIIVLLSLFAFVIVSIRRIEEDKETISGQSKKISTYNQQLEASNQQLRASNQQLDASMQELRAANQQLAATENNLKERIRELEVFNKATVGRELKMAELKKELEALRAK